MPLDSSNVSVYAKNQVVKFAARCREVDRQYEAQNNSKLDNGVYNKFVRDSPGNDSEIGKEDEEEAMVS